jgi:hypothetical protein
MGGAKSPGESKRLLVQGFGLAIPATVFEENGEHVDVGNQTGSTYAAIQPGKIETETG